ncbi:MAG TPA: hypothetical protein PLW65_02015 [Pseudomonadota bacterium]|nr:hypothetical protein [Pseudomonadota bacterium]
MVERDRLLVDSIQLRSVTGSHLLCELTLMSLNRLLEGRMDGAPRSWIFLDEELQELLFREPELGIIHRQSKEVRALHAVPAAAQDLKASVPNNTVPG